jgi:hypothetical protein
MEFGHLLQMVAATFIPRHQISGLRALDQGSFGQIYSGVYDGSPVAVKQCSSDGSQVGLALDLAAGVRKKCHFLTDCCFRCRSRSRCVSYSSSFLSSSASATQTLSHSGARPQTSQSTLRLPTSRTSGWSLSCARSRASTVVSTKTAWVISSTTSRKCASCLVTLHPPPS